MRVGLRRLNVTPSPSHGKVKNMKRIIRQLIVSLPLALFVSPVVVHAHCDTLQGPVVATARTALATGDVTPVLKWVQPADEPVIRTAFDRSIAVRGQSKDAAELADTWFFETLVRIHRAGEGAPYTGLKPGGSDEPGIAAADRALASGNSDELIGQTTEALRARLETKLARARELQAHAEHSVDAGRAFVAAYVDYVHFAEHLATLGAEAPAPVHAEHTH